MRGENWGRIIPTNLRFSLGAFLAPKYTPPTYFCLHFYENPLTTEDAFFQRYKRAIMKYQCLECGHKDNTLAQSRCPACGSAQVKSLSKTERIEEREFQPIRLAMMVLLWGVLLYKAYETFLT